MTNIITDVATLTTIPEGALNKVSKKVEYCICDAVLESTLIDEDITAVDLGIGILYIKKMDLEGNVLKYKFEPSNSLDKLVKETFANKQNPLEDVLIASLKDKFLDTYKNLC